MGGHLGGSGFSVEHELDLPEQTGSFGHLIYQINHGWDYIMDGGVDSGWFNFLEVDFWGGI